MKLRTSFFNETVFRKNISRFAPAWGIYLIGGLLVMLSVLSDQRFDYAASSLSNTIGPFGIINCIYALVVAQLLFGDLFSSRLCNALHALPLRREAWFGTHTVSGLLFSMVPHAIGALCLMPTLQEYWYVALLWLLGMALEYLFFFGVAVLCVFLTGNRFAMAAVYGIANFFSIILVWFIETLYEPLLWGVGVDTDGFMIFSPVVQLVTEQNLVAFDRSQTIFYENGAKLVLDHLDSAGWIYLGVLGAVGLVFMGAALLLYRRRALESAGDFLSVKKLNPVFTVIFTLVVGAVCQSFGDLIFNDRAYVFLVVGLTVGFFVSQMLLERTVKVFQPKRFLRLAILAGALVASLVITSFDPIGITRYVPDAEDVDVLYLQGYELTDPEDIEKAAAIHKKIIAKGKDVYTNLGVTFSYRRKDGTTVTRSYQIYAGSTAGQMLKETFFSRPEYVLEYTDWEEYLAGIKEIMIDGNELEIWNQNGYYPEYQRQLMEAIKADCEAGVMAQQWAYHQGADSKAWNFIDIRYTRPNGNTVYCSLRIPYEATNTRKWLDAHIELWDGIKGHGSLGK